MHISSGIVKQPRHQKHHQLLKIPKHLLPLQAAPDQAGAGSEDEEAPSNRQRPGTHRFWMSGRPACFNLVAHHPAETLAPISPRSRVPPCPRSQVPLQPPTHPAAGSHHARCRGHIRLPAGSRERTGSAIKSPRFPLFPLPRQLLPQSAGWGSGICHGKQRAGNKFPNCHMLTDTHVTSVRGFSCRVFPLSPPVPAASRLPPRGRGWGLCSAKQHAPRP